MTAEEFKLGPEKFKLEHLRRMAALEEANNPPIVTPEVPVVLDEREEAKKRVRESLLDPNCFNKNGSCIWTPLVQVKFEEIVKNYHELFEEHAQICPDCYEIWTQKFEGYTRYRKIYQDDYQLHHEEFEEYNNGSWVKKVIRFSQAQIDQQKQFLVQEQNLAVNAERLQLDRLNLAASTAAALELRKNNQLVKENADHQEKVRKDAIRSEYYRTHGKSGW